MIFIILIWRELKLHCASQEDLLWGCIKVPLAIRLNIAPGDEARRIVCQPGEEDPYFTPL